jgi:hypothetical protein
LIAIYAANTLKLDLTADKKKGLMGAYLMLTAFPDVKPGLEVLKKKGVRFAILSNGEPSMLQATAESAGIAGLLDAIISVEDVKQARASGLQARRPPSQRRGDRIRVCVLEQLGHQRRGLGWTVHLVGSSAARPSRRKSSGFRPNAS